MTLTDNRATIGHNQPPDYTQQTIDRLASEYPQAETETNALLNEARDLSKDVTEDNLPSYIGIIKKLRDLHTRLDKYHDAEKQPYLRGGQGCDGFFFSWMDKIRRRTGMRGAQPGAIDILQSRVDAYADRKRIEEENRRRREAEEAARKQQEAEAARRKAEREAEETRLAAERARLPHTIEAKTEIATAAEGVADQARIDAFMATNQAEIATIQANAKPADMVRERHEEGILTMAKKDDAVVTDYAAIDLNTLRHFIKRDEIDRAVRQWARNTNYAEQMPGVKITRRHGARVL
jgi:uncharacterized membrane protein YqiK